MSKEEFITTTAKEMFISIVTSEGFEYADNSELEELAKTCAKSAEVIWKIANPLR